MSKKHKKKKQPKPVNALTKEEMGLYGAPGMEKPPTKGVININDIINVVVRAKVIQVGGEMVQLELVELQANNIVSQPVFVWCPREHIRSSPIPSEPMPGEDPAWKGVENAEPEILTAPVRESGQRIVTPEETRM